MSSLDGNNTSYSLLYMLYKTQCMISVHGCKISHLTVSFFCFFLCVLFVQVFFVIKKKKDGIKCVLLTATFAAVFYDFFFLTRHKPTS